MRTWQAVTKTASAPAQLFHELSGSALVEATGTIPLRPEPPLSILLREMLKHAVSGWKWLERKRTQQLAGKRVRVSEMVSLGEKRFVSIVQVDGAQFLIGGAAGSVSLLAKLDRQEQQHAVNQCGCGVSAEKER